MREDQEAGCVSGRRARADQWLRSHACGCEGEHLCTSACPCMSTMSSRAEAQSHREIAFGHKAMFAEFLHFLKDLQVACRRLFLTCEQFAAGTRLAKDKSIDMFLT
ncbi:hypothetical protein EYF80_032071 [Liparis tanakae]|uniref:Uncharacterized protein n=1 Tax=Liparis tanakae TaxID=230148 RepID=A0A4Z2GY59_9TELE|nr:hypothetical protein EYF80_032071 [Liparis tanakae]